jgi:alkanesulfonate monooxygenase SsuD/methylene tetrahydromethanopterin reductase-like flavin-dependent oxidoreductase (luciferase family)
MAPASQAFSAEVCDGLILTNFCPERSDVVEENLEKGFAKAGGDKSLANFDLMSMVAVIVGNDLDACRQPLKWNLALYVGGMGARSKNFYNEYIRKIGYAETAEKVQSLYLDGKKSEAAAAIPDELIDSLHLVGPPERIRDRFQVWKKSKLGTMLVVGQQREALRLIAELALS